VGAEEEEADEVEDDVDARLDKLDTEECRVREEDNSSDGVREGGVGERDTVEFLEGDDLVYGAGERRGACFGVRLGGPATFFLRAACESCAVAFTAGTAPDAVDCTRAG